MAVVAKAKKGDKPWQLEQNWAPVRSKGVAPQPNTGYTGPTARATRNGCTSAPCTRASSGVRITAGLAVTMEGRKAR